jgi:biopolymer transport protein ExbB
MNAVMEYIAKGGVFIYPILGGAFWALTIMIERIVWHARSAAGLSRQAQSFFSILYGQGPEAASKHLASQKGLLKNILSAGLDNRTLPPQRIEEKMEAALLAELPRYAKYLNLLAALAALMPIFGLLGTVTGMIQTFNVIALVGTGDPKAMADGIAQALITTQAGLVAATPVILGHTLLTNRLRKINDTLRQACAVFLDYMKDSHD